MKEKNITQYYKNPYGIDSLNKRYEKDISMAIENLLEALFIRGKKDYKILNNQDITGPDDIKLIKKFLNDIKYMVNIKFNSVSTKIHNEDTEDIIRDVYNLEKSKSGEDEVVIDQDKVYDKFIKYYIKNEPLLNIIHRYFREDDLGSFRRDLREINE